MAPGAEQGRANPDGGRAVTDGAFEISAHPHGKSSDPVPAGDLRQQRKVWPRRFALRRNAHQPLQFEAVEAAAILDEGVSRAGGNTSLLRLLAGIDLEIKPYRTARPLHLPSDGLSQTGSIKRLDDVKQRESVSGLIGLQRPYEAQLEALSPPCPPLCRFLHAVFAEDLLAGREHGLNNLPGLLLRDRRKGHIDGVSPRGRGRGVHPRPDGSERLRGAGSVGRDQ